MGNLDNAWPSYSKLAPIQCRGYSLNGRFYLFLITYVSILNGLVPTVGLIVCHGLHAKRDDFKFLTIALNFRKTVFYSRTESRSYNSSLFNQSFTNNYFEYQCKIVILPSLMSYFYSVPSEVCVHVCVTPLFSLAGQTSRNIQEQAMYGA